MTSQAALGSGARAWAFSDATLSDDRRHRYTLGRSLTDATAPRSVVFVMLNPSTADETENDATIRKCIGYARRWGFDRLDVVNLFSWRATSPRDLLSVEEPSGGLANRRAIVETAQRAELVIAAWGGPYQPKRLGSMVSDYANNMALLLGLAGVHLGCLGVTKGGHPRHPLYMPGGVEPTPWWNS